MHETTGDRDDTLRASTDPAADGPHPGRSGPDTSAPPVPGEEIPIPKPPAVRPDPEPERPDSAGHRETEQAEPPSGLVRPEAQPDGSGESNWFAKLRIHREERPASHGPQDDSNAPASGEPTSQASSVPGGVPAPEAMEDNAASTPDALPSPGGHQRRIVFVRRSAQRTALHETAALLGVPDDALATRSTRAVLAGGAVLILLALLASNAGIALTIGAAIVPLILLLVIAGPRSARLNDPTIMLAVTGLGGVIVGGLLGWIAARLVASTWFDEGVLNFGAAGFGGTFARAAGTAGWLVWLVTGLVLPLAALAAALGVPVALHRAGRFPGSDNGLHLGAAAGAGYAIGTAAVFWSPLNVHPAPGFTVSDWTLMILGVSVLQPIAIVLGFAALGAGVWRYLRDQQIPPLVLPAVCGIGGLLLMRLGSLWIQPRQSHLWLEICWLILVVAGVAALFRLSNVSHPDSGR